MSSFERNLTWWVLACIVVGTGLGHLFPAIFAALGGMQLAQVNMPVAVLVWLMIVPMLLKIDYGAMRQVTEHWRGMGVTLFVNWAVKLYEEMNQISRERTRLMRDLLGSEFGFRQIIRGDVGGALGLGRVGCEGDDADAAVDGAADDQGNGELGRGEYQDGRHREVNLAAIGLHERPDAADGARVICLAEDFFFDAVRADAGARWALAGKAGGLAVVFLDNAHCAALPK